MLVLAGPQFVVERLFVGDQGLMVPLLHHLALVQHQDAVAVHDGAQTVSDDDRGATLAQN